MVITVEILQVKGKTHCVDFNLKELKVGGEKTKIDYNNRTEFVEHFLHVCEYEHIKNFKEAERDCL